MKRPPIHVDVNIVSNDILDIEKFRNWNPEYKNAEFILEDGNTFWMGSGKNVQVDVQCSQSWRYCRKNWSWHPSSLRNVLVRWNNRNHGTPMASTEFTVFWNVIGVYFSTKINWTSAMRADGRWTRYCTKRLRKPVEYRTFHSTLPVSHFMICVNELYAKNVTKKGFSNRWQSCVPVCTSHYWRNFHLLGNTTSVYDAP